MEPTHRPEHKRRFSRRQTATVRTAIQLFVEDDIASGRPANQRRYCDACQETQPAVGFIRYGRFDLCKACATGYELARGHGLALSIGQYVRDRRFGEEEPLPARVPAEGDDDADH